MGPEAPESLGAERGKMSFFQPWSSQRGLGCERITTQGVKSLAQQVHVILYGIIYLGLKGGCTSLLWGLCMNYNDTWTLWVVSN